VLYNLTINGSGTARVTPVVVRAGYSTTGESDVFIKMCGCGFPSGNCRTAEPTNPDPQHCGASTGFAGVQEDGGLAPSNVWKYDFDYITGLIQQLRQT